VEDIRQLVQRPPQPLEPITLWGIGVLVVSLLGFARTLQRTYQATWRLSPQGIRGYGWGLLGAAVLLCEAVATVLVGVLFAGVHNGTVLSFTLRLVLASALWWPVQWLLLGRRVGWRRLLPGALVLGVGQTVFIGLSGAYLQWSIVREATHYGLIGVTFVLVSWLLVLGLLVVLAAVLSAEMAGGSGPAAATLSSPRSDEVSPGRAS
jgi:membrane protein